MAFTDRWRRHWRRRRPVDTRALDALTRRAGQVAQEYDHLLPHQERIMSTPTPDPQGNIDADVAALTTDLSTFASLFPQIQAALAALPKTVDTSALDALVGQGNDLATKYEGLVPPAPPAPAGP